MRLDADMDFHMSNLNLTLNDARSTLNHEKAKCDIRHVILIFVVRWCSCGNSFNNWIGVRIGRNGLSWSGNCRYWTWTDSVRS